jgi:hypothetical protein
MNKNNLESLLSINKQEQINSNLGFNYWPEILNGRIAMLGFVILFIIETFTRKGILSYLN